MDFKINLSHPTRKLCCEFGSPTAAEGPGEAAGPKAGCTPWVSFDHGTRREDGPSPPLPQIDCPGALKKKKKS